jgi:hypothetical protein
MRGWHISDWFPSFVLCLGILTGCVAISVTPSGASAAEVTTEKHHYCDQQLVGPIQPGDTDTLAGKLSERILPKEEKDEAARDAEQTICLDSDGGSFPEAWRLFAYFRKNGIGTFVEAKQRCLDSCAIALLGGTTILNDEFEGPSRGMEPGAVIAFRLPKPAVGPGPYTKEGLEGAYRAVTDNLREMISASFYTGWHMPGNYMAMGLIRRLVEQPGHWYIINTLGRAFRNGIKVTPYQSPTAYEKIDQNKFLNFCNAAMIALFDFLPDDDDYTGRAPSIMEEDDDYIKKNAKIQEGESEDKDIQSEIKIHIETDLDYDELCSISLLKQDNLSLLRHDPEVVKGCYYSHTYSRSECYYDPELAPMLRDFREKIGPAQIPDRLDK